MSQDRIDAAFLAANIDPEFSAVIHAYHTDVLVYALANTLAKYMERVQELEYVAHTQYCVNQSCTKCIQDDPRTWTHD